MSVEFLSEAAKAARNYDAQGYAQSELPQGEEVGDIKFYRCSLKAGCKVSPALDGEKFVVLIFNGKKGYITTNEEMFNITEPAFFAPDFDRTPYTVHAVEDMEYIMGVFGLNKWDKEFYAKWSLHFPFFSLYSDGVQYDQDCKGPHTCSWSIIQPFQIGHVSIGVVRAIGEGTNEKGHKLLHQWNYCLGDSDFDLTVDNVTVAQKPGDWSFIFAGKDHKLLAKPGKEVFYVWVEYFTEEDLQKYYMHQIYNGSFSELS